MPPKAGLIVQIKGLGVPVQAPSNRNVDGFEVRWSSDPDLPPDLPTHVLNGEQEALRFLRLACDPATLSGESVKLVPILVEDGRNSVSMREAISAGADPESWNLVRVALAISGNANTGPVIDLTDWIGSRQEFQEGEHLRHAMKHGQARGMRNPSIFTHNDHAGHIINAANHMTNVRRQFNPSLRTAELVAQSIQDAVLDMDVDGLSHERALFYLSQIKTAFESLRQQRLNEADSLGFTEASAARKAQDQLDELNHANQEHYDTDPAPVRKPSGPRLH